MLVKALAAGNNSQKFPSDQLGKGGFPVSLVDTGGAADASRTKHLAMPTVYQPLGTSSELWRRETNLPH